MKRWTLLLSLCCVMITSALLPTPALAGGAVTNCNTFNDGGGAVDTLGEALVGGGTIYFNCSGRIVFPATFVIAANTRISASFEVVTLSGNGVTRLFDVNPGITFFLKDLTIADGIAPTGGGILNNGGMVATEGVTFKDNVAGVGGGAAIYNTGGGTLDVVNSTFTWNRATGDGGGIFTDSGVVNLTNNTFSENFANAGAAISNQGATVSVRNNIFANNPKGGNCRHVAGAFNNGGNNNIADDNTCPNVDVFTTEEINLGPLEGSPAYYIPQPGSVAIDEGDDKVCMGPVVRGLDQRGWDRPREGDGDRNLRLNCDIGSIEFTWPPPPVPLCADMDGSTNPIVRAEFAPDSYGIHCRVLVDKYNYIEGAGSIGNQEVIDHGVVHAVDVYSLYGRSAAGAQVCLQGTAAMLFLDAANAPRVPEWLPVTIISGFSCVTIPNVGTLALVANSTGAPEPVFQAPPASANIPAGPARCQVTTIAILNLRAEPTTRSEVLTLVPYGLTLESTEYMPGWYKVIYLNGQGWLSEQYLLVNLRTCRR